MHGYYGGTTVITTVTLNPAIDKMIVVKGMILGGVNRAMSTQIGPGGKGINVSRVVKRLGGETVALGFIGGNTGRCILHCLNREGIPTDFVEIEEESRVNLSVIGLATKSVTSFHEKGPKIRGSEVDALIDKIKRWAERSKIIVLSGSVPPGIPADIYREMISFIKSLGVKVFLDTHGEPLKEGIKAAPYLVKPNLEEMQELTGLTFSSDMDLIKAGEYLLDSGVMIGIVSLGDKGAFIFTRDKTLRAFPPEIEKLSTIGAGDSMIAGLVFSLALGELLEDAVSLGTAAGAATAMTMGTELCRPEEIERIRGRVRIEQIL